MVKNYADELGDNHGMRHTHETLLFQQGVNPKIVQEHLSYSSIKVTMDTYSHVLPDMQRQAVEALRELFKSTDTHQTSQSKTESEKSQSSMLQTIVAREKLSRGNRIYKRPAHDAHAGSQKFLRKRTAGDYKKIEGGADSRRRAPRMAQTYRTAK